MEEEKGKFKVIKVTDLQAFKEGDSIPESDLTIQTDSQLIQLEHEDSDKQKKSYIIKPGCFYIQETGMGTILSKFDLRQYELLESIDNTKNIIDESSRFFDRLSVYKELKREPRRSILLCSMPGVGKTAAINKVCKGFLEEDKGTCVVVWDTADIRAGSVNKFFMNYSKFDKKVSRLVMVIEDINGGTTEDDYGSKGVNTSLLNFLDGVGNPFKGVPSFIIATTNNPERSVGALIDRPGRFDKVIEMKPPNKEECEQLLGFISKRDLSEDDKEAAAIASKNNFSIAHLQEIVVRSRLDDISMLEVCKQLVKHKERFKNAFEEVKPRLGLGLG